jgi:hypothetical protein
MHRRPIKSEHTCLVGGYGEHLINANLEAAVVGVSLQPLIVNVLNVKR